MRKKECVICSNLTNEFTLYIVEDIELEYPICSVCSDKKLVKDFLTNKIKIYSNDKKQ